MPTRSPRTLEVTHFDRLHSRDEPEIHVGLIRLSLQKYLINYHSQ